MARTYCIGYIDEDTWTFVADITWDCYYSRAATTGPESYYTKNSNKRCLTITGGFLAANNELLNLSRYKCLLVCDSDPTCEIINYNSRSNNCKTK